MSTPGTIKASSATTKKAAKVAKRFSMGEIMSRAGAPVKSSHRGPGGYGARLVCASGIPPASRHARVTGLVS